MSSPLQTSFDSSRARQQLSSSTTRRLSTSAPGRAPSPDTSSALRELFDELSRQDSSSPEPQSSFEDTLARISSQHETYKEDSPENDAAFQALFQPIETAQQLEGFVKPSSAQEFVTLHKSLNTMPDRPKTSPSKLALSVVLKPNAAQEHNQRLHDARARLQLLAPLDEDAASAQMTEELESPRTLGFHLHDVEEEEPSLELVEDDHRSTRSGKGREEANEDASSSEASSSSSHNLRLESLTSHKHVEPLSQKPQLAAPPLVVPPAKLDATPQPATPTPRADGLSSSVAQGASTLLKDAVTQSHRARQVALSMEQSPRGQKIELEITDSFGKPLTLKISFEHQRARAACYGSNFHDPAQLDYVLDAVRTALAASGYELGDFITHHQRHRDHRSSRDPEQAHDPSQAEEQENSTKKKEILHVVGIINRIA